MLYQQCNVHDPSKYAGSDSDVLVMASNGHYSQHVPRIQPDHILYAGSDFLHPMWFCFSKEGPDHIVQNWPGSNLDGLVWVWQNTSGMAASWCARIIGPWQNRTGSLPVSHFQTWLHSSTDGPLTQSFR